MPNPYDVIYEFTDEDGDKATMATKVPTGFTLAQYTEFARALAILKNNVVLGIVSAASMIVGVDLSALTLNLTGDASDVEDVGAFQFRSAAGFPVKLNVPGIDELKVSAGSDNLNLSDSAIAAISTAMLSGVAVTGGTIIPCDINQSDLIALDYARENFRPTGRRA